MDLIYFILSSYGLTTMLVYGRIFNPIRPKHHFFHCPLCVGFWVSALLVCLNPFTDLFTYSVSPANCFVMGALGAGTSYALSMLISDEGIRIEHTQNNKTVDAPKSKTLLQG